MLFSSVLSTLGYETLPKPGKLPNDIITSVKFGEKDKLISFIQSIQENLSTFSSHITNIVEITNNITSNSLVLLDELGSGTDPIEGANLAISILKYLFDLGVVTLSTTHYQELKNYCIATNGYNHSGS